jgi:hypothetical protein
MLCAKLLCQHEIRIVRIIYNYLEAESLPREANPIEYRRASAGIHLATRRDDDKVRRHGCLNYFHIITLYSVETQRSQSAFRCASLKWIAYNQGPKIFGAKCRKRLKNYVKDDLPIQKR